MTNQENEAAPAPGRRFAIFYPLSYISFALVVAGCTGPKPLKGGTAVTARTTKGAFVQTLAQGENPSAPSRQIQETVRVRTYTLPACFPIQNQASSIQNPAATLPTFQHSTTPGPFTVTEREETRASTELGSAQKDTARELGAKLSSLRGIVWVGLALFIFGIASFAWPPLRAIIGSVTTSAAITLGGVALMILPTLIVGHELLILGGVALSVGGWFLAHRHGQLRGQLDSLAAPKQSDGGPSAPKH